MISQSGRMPDFICFSQRSGLVARLEDRLRPEQDEVSMAAVWRLPEGLHKAEGLVIGNGMSPWVALDLELRGARARISSA